jgi:hypothetical protein
LTHLLQFREHDVEREVHRLLAPVKRRPN